MSIPIDEIFGPAHQGEGRRMGVPSLFVRLGGCNLTCSGFGCKVTSPLDNKTVITGCDSIHAVNSKHFKHKWTYYDKSFELIDEINKYINTHNSNVEKYDLVITGGEPLIHHKDVVVIDMLEYYISRGHKITIETNGTIPIDFIEYPIYKQVTFSMSVKTSTSGEAENKRWKPDVVNNYLKNTIDSYFKFVLSKKTIEENEIELFDFLKLVPTFGVVYLMPLGETETELKVNAKAVYEYALKHGFRYSDRIHIRVYNDLRGV